VHPAGADCREGAILVPAGRLLDPPAVGIAASVGLVRVLATPRPRVAVLGTGDELVGPGTPPAPWQLRRSNTAALAALFAPDAETRVSSSGDAPEALAAAIESALAGSDALVLTGGVSAGRWDAVPAALAAAGIRTLFHKVAQRPGKPLWAGVTADGRPIFGLPGNPVAALICGRRYVTPLLRALAGRPGGPPRQVRLADPPAHFHLTRFLPVRLAGMGPVSVQAHAVPVRGSGDFAGLGPSDGFVEVPARSRGRPASLAPFRAWIPEIPYP
jgi:molybdopterin molybdotransferase